MDNVKSAVMAVCILSGAKCIIGNISAVSALKNQIEMMLNIMLAIAMTAPFVNGIKNFELPDISEYHITEYGNDIYTEALAEKVSENIEDILIQQIEAAGLSFEKIDVEVNISADYSIFISRVTVISEDFEKTAEIIHNSLGSETEVINGNY